jgi:hypothetical protein
VRRPVREEWESFALVCFAGTRVHKDHVQYREMRKAFYAGANGILHRMLRDFTSGDEPTEEDLSKVDLIKADLEQFLVDVKEGRA